MRTLPVLQRGLDLPGQGVTVLLSLLTLHGCCLNNRGHVHSPVAPGPAQGLNEGVVRVEPRLPFTQPPLYFLPRFLTLGTLLGTPKTRTQRRPSSTRGLSISSSRFTPYL